MTTEAAVGDAVDEMHTETVEPVEFASFMQEIGMNMDNNDDEDKENADDDMSDNEESALSTQAKHQRYKQLCEQNRRESEKFFKELNLPKGPSVTRKVPAKTRMTREERLAAAEMFERRTSGRLADNPNPVDYASLGDDWVEPGERRGRRARGQPTQFTSLEPRFTCSLEPGELDPVAVFGNKMINNTPSLFRFMRPPKPQPRLYGEVPGVPVGVIFFSYEEMRWAGVHYDTCAGISTGYTDGAYSVVLNGGYDDDVDNGETFVMSGSGGRDLKGTATAPKNLRTAPQTRDMELVGRNAKLAQNVESGEPVRVTRGWKSKGGYAPPYGFRYDGVYSLDKYEFVTGKSGYKIILYYFSRLPDQAPAPWLQPLDQKAWTDEQLSILAEERRRHGVEPTDADERQAMLAQTIPKKKSTNRATKTVAEKKRPGRRPAAPADSDAEAERQGESTGERGAPLRRHRASARKMMPSKPLRNPQPVADSSDDEAPPPPPKLWSAAGDGESLNSLLPTHKRRPPSANVSSNCVVVVTEHEEDKDTMNDRNQSGERTGDDKAPSATPIGQKKRGRKPKTVTHIVTAAEITDEKTVEKSVEVTNEPSNDDKQESTTPGKSTRVRRSLSEIAAVLTEAQSEQTPAASELKTRGRKSKEYQAKTPSKEAFDDGASKQPDEPTKEDKQDTTQVTPATESRRRGRPAKNIENEAKEEPVNNNETQDESATSLSRLRKRQSTETGGKTPPMKSGPQKTVVKTNESPMTSIRKKAGTKEATPTQNRTSRRSNAGEQVSTAFVSNTTDDVTAENESRKQVRWSDIQSTATASPLATGMSADTKRKKTMSDKKKTPPPPLKRTRLSLSSKEQ